MDIRLSNIATTSPTENRITPTGHVSDVVYCTNDGLLLQFIVEVRQLCRTRQDSRQYDVGYAISHHPTRPGTIQHRTVCPQKYKAREFLPRDAMHSVGCIMVGFMAQW